MQPTFDDHQRFFLVLASPSPTLGVSIIEYGMFQDWFPSGEAHRVRLGDSASSVRQLAEEMLKREVEEAQKG